jgi:hypothetical protein
MQNVAIDTQSDVTTCLREHLTGVRPVLPDTVSGLSGSASLGPTRGSSGIGCSAAPVALGVPALLHLEVAVEQHLKLPQFSPLICHLGEKKLREWLEHHPDKAVDTSPFDLNQIQINDDKGTRQTKCVLRLLLHNPTLFLPHICPQRLLSCLLFVLGYGWKCLDFDRLLVVIGYRARKPSRACSSRGIFS